MQAAIRTVGGELAQAAAEGMMSVDLRRAEMERAICRASDAQVRQPKAIRRVE